MEINIEGDFNEFWGPGKAVDEPHREWNYLGKQFIGQPSILYTVPFRLDSSGRVATGGGDGHRHVRRVGKRSQIDKDHAIAKGGAEQPRRGDGEARLAAATGTGQGQQTQLGCAELDAQACGQ